ncbi:MAG: hypothetical protein JWM61_138 [Micrococcaceae bacterium]|jgi:uncharacterized membrane protein YqjE|nr:hypothetical protein [Micrococcaceae bacterium]
MLPDESASDSPARDPRDPLAPDLTEPAGRGRLVLTVLAVVFAAIGLVSLAAILATAFLQGTVWPGFVLASYFCLPIAFLLMAALVVWSVLARRRS